MKELTKKEELKLLDNISYILIGAQGVLEAIGQGELAYEFRPLGSKVFDARRKLKKEVTPNDATMDSTDD